MDRFIVNMKSLKQSYLRSLKSNMDRFIEVSFENETLSISGLKSNMDRFIAVTAAKKKHLHFV